MARVSKEDKQELVKLVKQYQQAKTVQQSTKLADEIEKKVQDIKSKA